MSVEHVPTLDQVRPQPTGGIDWASENHAIAVVGPDGEQIDRFTVARTAAALTELSRRLNRAAVAEVAIERVDGPVVDALLEAGFAVVVIAPRQLKNLRSRYGQPDNKDDRLDALVLAVSSVGYSKRITPEHLYAHITAAPCGLIGPDGDARTTITLALVTTLQAL